MFISRAILKQAHITSVWRTTLKNWNGHGMKIKNQPCGFGVASHGLVIYNEFEFILF
jgi:hypothetical protein